MGVQLQRWGGAPGGGEHEARVARGLWLFARVGFLQSLTEAPGTLVGGGECVAGLAFSSATTGVGGGGGGGGGAPKAAASLSQLVPPSRRSFLPKRVETGGQTLGNPHPTHGRGAPGEPGRLRCCCHPGSRGRDSSERI
jgi:hypothetical protein